MREMYPVHGHRVVVAVAIAIVVQALIWKYKGRR